MGISGWDAVPGNAERGLVGELARAILLAAVSDGIGRPCLRTSQPWSRTAGVTPSSRVSSRHSWPPNSTRPEG